MASVSKSTDSVVDGVEKTSTTTRVVDGFTSLLDEVDSEAIAEAYEIGIHSDRHDFEAHVKTGLRLGIADPNTFEDLAQQTDVYAELESISQGHFSRLTKRRPWEAFAQLANAILQLPQFYHPFGGVRRRMERVLDRWVVGFDGTKLPTKETMVTEIDGDVHKLRPENGCLKLHTAARLDPATSQPIANVVTAGHQHDSPYFEDLLELVEAHEDLDEIIATFDKGYVKYGRFVDLKESDVDFVTPLKENARHTVEETICDREFDVEEDGDVTHVTDEWIELSDTGERFRKVTVRIADSDKDDDEQVNTYLTTLPPAEYDPLDVGLIYAVRWLIEIMFRTLKQHTNIQNFHSRTLNGALVELFCSLLAYILAEYYHRRYHVKGGLMDAIKRIRNYWNKSLAEYG